jgi:Cytochrome c554 and c-prime
MGMTRMRLVLPCCLLVALFSAARFIGPAFAGTQTPPTSSALDNNPRARYVGDSACLSCHKEQAISYQRTAHHLTSQLANTHTVLGPFREGSNVLTIYPAHTSEPGLYFRMEEKNGNYYETAVTSWDNTTQTRSERIDIVTGSGVRGATYLYWDGDRLYELPVSYWTDGHQWINSPGYDNGTAKFSRPINPGCLECHATYINPLSPDPLTNRYEKASLVTGISCETCHGPGVDHVARNKAGSAAAEEQAILNPAKFSRDRQVDLCALCHNGIQREAIAPAFSYVPGEPLTNYFKPIPADTLEHPDVHGNQVGLLQRSRCYLSSPNLSCSTCHDVHAQERPATAYSDRCLTCHRWESCGEAKALGHKIANNCIDCHMPVEPTNVIVSETGGRTVRAKMRNHWIKVYPDAHLP